jgi:hypothetical protein
MDSIRGNSGPTAQRRVAQCSSRLGARCVGLLFPLVLLSARAHAHIGSPDTFLQASIGPYTVLLAAHPPATTPGALELDLRFNPDDHLTAISAALDNAPPTPVHLVLDGTASTSLWSPTAAAQTLHLTVQGSRGPATYTVTLPATPQTSSSWPNRFGLIATRSGETSVWLLVSAVALALAVVLFVVLPAGNPRHPYRRRLLLSATVVILLAAAAILSHRPPPTTTLTATLTNAHLDLTLTNPAERFTDLVPDHGKLLHLFLIREPRKDVLLHLHPQQLSAGRFTSPLPAMPPGVYTLFADLYHREAGPELAGRSETATLRLDLPPQPHTTTTDPDDTIAVLPAIADRVANPPVASSPVSGEQQLLRTAHLPDGYTLQLRTPADLAPLHAVLLEATLLDPAGQPPQDMALYLGMNAHAVVLRSDDAVFAHIHPGGTLPMLAGSMLAGSMLAGSAMTMPEPRAPVLNTATIPYGFPTPGLYRVFVQMKHGTRVETAAFDLSVH